MWAVDTNVVSTRNMNVGKLVVWAALTACAVGCGGDEDAQLRAKVTELEKEVGQLRTTVKGQAQAIERLEVAQVAEQESAAEVEPVVLPVVVEAPPAAIEEDLEDVVYVARTEWSILLDMPLGLRRSTRLIRDVGLKVLRVGPNSLLEKLGIEKGDTIVSIADVPAQAFLNDKDWKKFARSRDADEPLVLEGLRKGEFFKVDARPMSDAAMLLE